MKPYSRQSINKQDLIAVKNVLLSKSLTQGPKVPEFERKIANYVKSNYAVACNSATSGLHLACLALGLKKNDLVWTSSNTFVASANAPALLGCKIDFLDISLKDFNIDLDKLEKKLKTSKKKPKVIINVHFAGKPSNQKEIYNLSKIYNFKIIEDASHALGAKKNNFLVGSNKWSDFTVFSFHPVKLITTGEGGMVTTNNKNYFNRMRIFREHGLKRFKSKKPYNYNQIELGLNYRMTDISAALGISQLSRLNQFNKKRNFLADNYKKFFQNNAIEFQQIEDDCFSSYHLFVVLLKKRDEVYNELLKKNFYCPLHYIPMYRHQFYKASYKNFPNCEKYFRCALSLPLYPDLKIKDQMKVIKLINNHIS
jgi:UDP-4-amino-4,6-dideoxy-N-acetyl-beta-L-altrosamine transaminase